MERAKELDEHKIVERAKKGDEHIPFERAKQIDEHIPLERAKTVDKHRQPERARQIDEHIVDERAKWHDKHKMMERAKNRDEHIAQERTNQKGGVMQNREDVTAVRMLVRLREAFQSMRTRTDNRIGRKADGTTQDIKTARVISVEDHEMFVDISKAAKEQENKIEKKLKKVLKRFKIYNEYLSKVKGVGPIAAGWIIAEYNIEIATTVSKMWQFTGLNPGMVVGKKRKENKDGTFSYITTDKMIRGDKLTSGFVAPFNKRLRKAMVGVLAEGFIKAKSPYALKYYYPYKERLAQSENFVEVTKKGGKKEFVAWNQTTKDHRHKAAKRYMIKMFLKDLYVAWRTIEGLPVREPYQEEYLGHKHAA